MLYIFHGNDAVRVRGEAQKRAGELSGGSEILTISPEAVTEDLLQDLIGAHSMFREREVYIIDTLSNNEPAFEIFLALIKDIHASPNAFVIIEGKLLGKDEKLLEKHSEEMKSFVAAVKKEFNIFALTDALVNRDKKALWILLLEAWRAGKTSEEIVGTLFWQLKTVNLAIRTKSAEEAMLKPFVFTKAKGALKKYTEAEIGKITHALVMLYHEGHAGKWDIDHALEAWVLGL